ncbi:MAG TPA: hypothetical protein VM096_03275 [Vicinamibacterales bacterium]|nr:hypothetical protein [Vicinamibacterales bacterium]
MHADRPGDRPRLLYWYRTAPGIALGRSPLDEDAIRTIEDQHPDIDFDWPAILALAEVMTPEDETAPPRPQPHQQQQQRQGKRRGRDAAPSHESMSSREPAASSREEPRELPSDGVDATADRSGAAEIETTEVIAEPRAAIEVPPPSNRLVEELAGREIGSRLRARHAEIIARIDDLDVDGSVKDAWFKRAEAIDPELWMTPEAVLEGVRQADAQYEKLRTALATPS